MHQMANKGTAGSSKEHHLTSGSESTFRLCRRGQGGCSPRRSPARNMFLLGLVQAMVAFPFGHAVRFLLAVSRGGGKVHAGCGFAAASPRSSKGVSS
jgi:hypothetical protein